MSLLLDALKQAEKNRRKEETAGLAPADAGNLIDLEAAPTSPGGPLLAPAEEQPFEVSQTEPRPTARQEAPAEIPVAEPPATSPPARPRRQEPLIGQAPAVPASTQGPDLFAGTGRPGPTQARNLLQAGHGRRSRLLFPLLVILILVASAIILSLYFLLAQQSSVVPELASMPAPAAPVADQPPAPVQPPIAIEPPVAAAPDASPPGPGAQAQAGMADTPALAMPAVRTPLPIGPEQAATGEESGPAAPASSSDGTAGAGQPRVSFAKKKVPNQFRLQLAAAHQALQRGDLQGAESLYRGMLTGGPLDVQPRFGLAAVALGQQQPARAREHYQWILEVEPDNPFAWNGLAASGGLADAARHETGLRRQIEQHPGRHYLHYALGNFYVTRQRWKEAQQAYFEAFALAPDNSVYAYNLAISLERLGQEPQALEFYRRALRLSDGQSGPHPDAAGLLEKINRLGARHDG